MLKQYVWSAETITFFQQKGSFRLQFCNCYRKFVKSKPPEKTSSIKFNETTCGKDAFQRGPGQKVIAYSYYEATRRLGNMNRKYFEGLEANIKLLDKAYPGWKIRLYTDVDPEGRKMKTICRLACTHESFDICYALKLPGNPMTNVINMFPMIWRFLPTLDPQVRW